MQRRVRLTAMLAASAVWLAPGLDTRADDAARPPAFRIAATAIVRNAAIEAMYDGMVDRLRALGYRHGDNVTIRFEDARADTVLAGDIVRGFVRERADVIVAFTLPSVEAALGASGRTPVIAAGLDAESVAKLNPHRRARPLTGIMQGTTDEEQFAMIRALMPAARAVAIPVDSDRDEIPTRLGDLIAVGRISGLQVVRLPVSLSRGAVSSAIRDLPRGEAVVLIDKASLPDAPVEALVGAATDNGLPVFATDEDSVVRGAVAAMVVDPVAIGQQMGDLVAQILSQPAAARQPFGRARATRMVVNREAAMQAAIPVPEPAEDPGHVQVLEWSEDAVPRPRPRPPPPDGGPVAATAGDGEAVAAPPSLSADE